MSGTQNSESGIGTCAPQKFNAKNPHIGRELPKGRQENPKQRDASELALIFGPYAPEKQLLNKLAVRELAQEAGELV